MMNRIRFNSMVRWSLAGILTIGLAGMPFRALALDTDDYDEITVEGSATAESDDDSTGSQQSSPSENPEQKGAGAKTTTVVSIKEKDKREYSNSFLRPLFGAIFFNDRDRFATGFLLEPNLANTDELIIGPVFGLIYSNIETDGSADLQDNDFILQIPAELKLAWVPRNFPKISLGAHGGVNVIYSQARAFGNSADTDRFNVYADVGADVGFRISRALEIGVRPDWTFLEDFDLFTLTVGLGVAI